MAYPARARERAMKREEVILRMLSQQLTFWQAATVLRVSPGQLRRLMAAYRRCGFDGLDDRLGLCRQKYFDISVRHFHEKLREEYGFPLSYTWVKQLPQGAGLVVRAPQRGILVAHSRRT